MLPRSMFWLWLIALSLFGSSCAPQAEPVAESQQAPPAVANARGEAVTAAWRVVRVIDGDTIEVLQDGKTERVRLEGIDCPESGQDFGTRAKQFASELLFGRDVVLVPKGKDRYGRILAEIELTGGRNANREIVKGGFAWHYKKYSTDETLARLEVEAREAKRGLWADPNPIPPWEWRDGTGRIAERPIELGQTHWLNIGTGTRHNAKCKNFAKTKQGRYCRADEGRPCGICGG